MFTGCGKKRSDESMAGLVELNSEPAVEELSKQILSEAKLWEALQEARAEMQRGREGVRVAIEQFLHDTELPHSLKFQPNMIPRDVPLPLTMSGFRRKRSSAKTESLTSTYNVSLSSIQKKTWMSLKVQKTPLTLLFCRIR